MTVSSITGITAEGQPKELSSFLRAGVMYVVWTDIVSGVGALRRMRWKPHTSTDFTEVIAPLLHPFNNISVLYIASSDSLLAVWDDAGGSDRVANGSLYSASFNVTTGAVLSGPTLIKQGANPKLTFRGAASTDILLYFKTPKNVGVYGCLSLNNGVTWQSSEPLITGQVLNTDSIKVVAYDPTHVSIAQTGGDTRSLSEIGIYKRTRPLCRIINDPTDVTKFYVTEPSKFDNVTLTDNLRGSITMRTDNSEVLHLSGVQQGTSDSVGSVSRLTVSGTTITNSASAGPVGGVAGHNLVSYTPSLGAGTVAVVLPGATSYAVDMAVSSSCAYVAEYSDSTTAGQFVVVRLSDGVTATPFSGVTGVRAVAVANFTAPFPLIFVASTESGVERLRVYEENALTPTLLLNVKLTARANSISVVAGSSPATVRVIVSMVDRLCLFDYYTSVTPIRLVDTLRFAGGNQFFRTVTSASGVMFVAAGSAGVLVFNPTGKLLAQLKVSGEYVLPWKALTSYGLDNLVQARPVHPFSPSRYYLKATTGGTSGASEPSWATTGTVADASVVWTPQAVIDGVATDVALVESTKRVYAVGSAGGNLGTDGRVWILSAQGLI